MSKRNPYVVQIRDPIHGTLRLNKGEIAMVDHAAYQRLRTIKQLGLADLAFPGATHTRYVHGLGTMHVASRIYTNLARNFELSAADDARLHQTVRLAAMVHDIGHAPLSHTTEAFMPPVSELETGHWAPRDTERKADHEDYTIKIITDSSFTELLRRKFSDVGVSADAVAALVAGYAPTDEVKAHFRAGGRDYFPMLRQCVSSELDADRMDYLLRDSYFAGVPYGRYDAEWLLENVLPVEKNGSVHLGLHARASFGFEDFLLSRYHMFLSVYFHHISVGYEVMLHEFHKENTGELEIPGDVDGYLACDDIYLFTKLRASKSPWAKRVVERKAFRRLLEVKDDADTSQGESGSFSADLKTQMTDVVDALKAAGINAREHTVKGRLSKYFSSGSQNTSEGTYPLFIVEEGRTIPIEDYSPLYKRYSGELRLHRVYVDPAQLSDARAIADKITGRQTIDLSPSNG